MKWTNLGKDPGLPDEPFWTVGKIISGSVVGVYLIVAAFAFGPADTFEILVSSVAPILCIWTPEIMANYEGLGVLHGRPILRPSHVRFVYYLGWIVLLLPVVQIVIIGIGSK